MHPGLALRSPAGRLIVAAVVAVGIALSALLLWSSGAARGSVDPAATAESSESTPTVQVAGLLDGVLGPMLDMEPIALNTGRKIG